MPHLLIALLLGIAAWAADAPASAPSVDITKPVRVGVIGLLPVNYTVGSNAPVVHTRQSIAGIPDRTVSLPYWLVRTTSQDLQERLNPTQKAVLLGILQATRAWEEPTAKIAAAEQAVTTARTQLQSLHEEHARVLERMSKNGDHMTKSQSEGWRNRFENANKRITTTMDAARKTREDLAPVQATAMTALGEAWRPVLTAFSDAEKPATVIDPTQLTKGSTTPAP